MFGAADEIELKFVNRLSYICILGLLIMVYSTVFLAVIHVFFLLPGEIMKI